MKKHKKKMEEDEDEAVSQEIISEKIPNHWIEQKDRERERERASRDWTCGAYIRVFLSVFWYFWTPDIHLNLMVVLPYMRIFE